MIRISQVHFDSPREGGGVKKKEKKEKAAYFWWLNHGE